jgi:tetratricopeptide (TPR) repeat protein
MTIAVACRVGARARWCATRAPILWGGVVALAAASPACAPKPGSAADVKARIATMKEEDTPDKLLDRGKAFASMGDTTRAEQYYAAAIARGGSEVGIEPLLLSVCVQDGRYRVAIEYAEQYLKTHANDLRVRFLLGTIYEAVGDPARARSNLQIVVDGHPEDPDAHYALAILARDGDHDPVAADQHFREYLRLNPRGPHAEEAQASLLKNVTP